MDVVDLNFDFFEKILTEEYFNYLRVMDYNISNIFFHLLNYYNHISSIHNQNLNEKKIYRQKRSREKISVNFYKNQTNYGKYSKNYNNQTENKIKKIEYKKKTQIDIFTYNIINLYLYCLRGNIQIQFQPIDLYYIFCILLLKQYNKNENTENILQVFNYNAYNYENLNNYIKLNYPEHIETIANIYKQLNLRTTFEVVKQNILTIAQTNQVIGKLL